MTDTFADIYDTGTITLTNGSINFTGSGVLWNDITSGDDVYAQGLVGVIDSVSGAGLDHGTLKKPWLGAGGSNLPYLIKKVGKSRFDPALTQAKVREFISLIESAALIYSVADSGTPDNSLGEDGQYALRLSPQPAIYWKKISGTWQEVSSFVGINIRGLWDPTVVYAVNDVVSRLGIAYFAKTANVNAAPELSTSQWGVLLERPNRYDIAFAAAGKPASGEILLNLVMTTTVSFAVGMAESQAVCGTPPTATASFAIRKNGTPFATLTFAAPNTVGSFSTGTVNTLDAGDVLSILAPAQDATLSDLSITLTGYR